MPPKRRKVENDNNGANQRRLPKTQPPKPVEELPRLLKPGERFLGESDQPAALDSDEMHEHCDYHAPSIPMRDLIDITDPCFEFYQPWQSGYRPALQFFVPSTEHDSQHDDSDDVHCDHHNECDHQPIESNNVTKEKRPRGRPRKSVPSASRDDSVTFYSRQVKKLGSPLAKKMPETWNDIIKVAHLPPSNKPSTVTSTSSSTLLKKSRSRPKFNNAKQTSQVSTAILNTRSRSKK